MLNRWDYNLFDVLDERGGHPLASVFPRAPPYWPGEWGLVPRPLPIELSLYRQELIAADKSSERWREVHLIFLEQIAAGWCLEYCDPTDSKSHLLRQPIAKAILDVRVFFFLPVASKALPAFRLKHQLNDVAIPDQRAPHQAAWSGIQWARMAERALSHLTPPCTPSSAAVPEVDAVGSTGEATSTGGPVGRRNELWTSIGAGSIQVELRAALAGETDISVGIGGERGGAGFGRAAPVQQNGRGPSCTGRSRAGASRQLRSRRIRSGPNAHLHLVSYSISQPPAAIPRGARQNL